MKKTFEIEFGWAEYRIDDVPIGLTIYIGKSSYTIEKDNDFVFSCTGNIPKLFL